jgi:hypothetical protein
MGLIAVALDRVAADEHGAIALAGFIIRKSQKCF